MVCDFFFQDQKTIHVQMVTHLQDGTIQRKQKFYANTYLFFSSEKYVNLKMLPTIWSACTNMKMHTAIYIPAHVKTLTIFLLS